MRFFTSSLMAIAALASSVLAQQNPISKPDGSVPLVAGESTTITWTPTTTGPITLTLRQGPSNNLADVFVIVGGSTNGGSFTWSIPKDLPSGDNYAIQITDDKTGEVNFTPLLAVKSDVGPKASSGSSSAASTSASSTTSGSSTTTSKAETTSKPAHNSTSSTTLMTSTTATNGTITTSYGSSNGTLTRSAGGNGTRPTASGSSKSGPSPTASSSPSSPSSTAPSSGAVSLVMNSPLALVVCVLGAVMYLN